MISPSISLLIEGEPWGVVWTGVVGGTHELAGVVGKCGPFFCIFIGCQ